MDSKIQIVGGTFFVCVWLFLVGWQVRDVKREVREVNTQLERIAAALERQHEGGNGDE